MNDVVINVKNVTKTYRLYDTHADRVREAFHPFRKKFHRTFNALTDVSFDVRKGQSIGIIGRNGSGKSTLLQIICGILKPTTGTVEVKGKIGALLELGAGFNPEFTGRENVYMNASILGLTKDQIDARFDDIAAFADIGAFMDQPVRTYSSGMYVRLAFAVQVQIKPDILIIDEALAVGDEAFQRKCFSKINAVQEQGVTILFVSHSPGTVVELCKRSLLIDQGEIILSGNSKLVVSKYHQLVYARDAQAEKLRNEIRRSFNEDIRNKTSPATATEAAADDKGADSKDYFDPALVPQSTIVYADNNDYGVAIQDVRIETLSGVRVNNLHLGDRYLYKYRALFSKPAFQVRFGMMIKTVSGLEVGGAVSSTPSKAIVMVEGNTIIEAQFYFRCLLHPGTYFMNAGIVGTINGAETYLDRRIDIVMFRVLPEINLLSTALVSFDVEPAYSIIRENAQSAEAGQTGSRQ